ncbi:hypothetical protein KI387_013824, partial [Taxus chinensis]
ASPMPNNLSHTPNDVASVAYIPILQSSKRLVVLSPRFSLLLTIQSPTDTFSMLDSKNSA